MAIVIINTAVATEKTHTSTTCSCTKQKAISSRYRCYSYIRNGLTCKERSSQKREGNLLELKKEDCGYFQTNAEFHFKDWLS